jgi:hypothetical protein
LPASAQECAASASIEAEPVITAAIDFAIAITRLALKAMITVSRLSLPSALAGFAEPSTAVIASA